MQRFFSLALAVLSSVALWAYDFCAADTDGTLYYYNIVGVDSVEVTWGGTSQTAGTESYTGELTIPATATDAATGTTYNVVGIGAYAFNHCTMTRLDTGDGVRYIGEYGVSSSNTKDKALTTLVLREIVDSIASWAFSYDYYLTDVALPADLSYLGDRAFYYCDRMEKISVPDKITTIMGLTFYYCSALTDISLPASLDSVGTNAFGVCSALEEIHLPSTLRVLGNNAFNQCQKLSRVYCDAETPPTCTVNTSATFNLVSIDAATLYVPVGTYEAYAATDPWSSFGTIIEMTSAAVSTSAATDVTATTAILHGVATAGYEGVLAKKGFEYWKDEEGADTLSVTVLADELTARVGGLDSDTKYLFRAFAIDSNDTYYGAEETFTTLFDSDALYAELVAALAAASSYLDSTWETIGDYGDDISDNFAEAYAALCAALEALSSALDTTYYNGALAAAAGDAFRSQIAAFLSLVDALAAVAASANDAVTSSLAAVSSSAVSAGKGDIYTVQGVRVSEMSQNKVYIVDGKKVLAQ